MAGGEIRLSLEEVPYTTSHAGQVREFADLVAKADRHEAFGEQTLFNLDDGAGHHVLLTSGEEIVGYAQVDRGSAELAVHPEHRGQGIGGRLVRQTKEHDPDAAIWAHGNLPHAQQLATSTGLTSVRELLYMQAPVQAADVPEPPPGITITTFTPADAEDWLALNAQAFASHPEQGRLTMDDLHTRMGEDWFEEDNFWLARDTEGRLVGYMWVKREPGASIAEIYVLGVSPLAQGKGLGKYLTTLSLARMADRGVTVMDLYVEGDNHPALATYRARGFTPAVTHVQYR